MKITIINGDNSLGINGEFFIGLDFSEVPDEVNAVQWDGDSGVIEYLNSTGKPDEPITKLPSFYAGLKTQWDASKAEKNKAEADHQALLNQVEAVAAEIAAEEAKYAKWKAENSSNQYPQDVVGSPQ